MKKFKKWLQIVFLVWSLKKQIKDIYKIVNKNKFTGINYHYLFKAVENLIDEILYDIRRGNYNYLQQNASKRLDKAKLYIQYPNEIPKKAIHLLRQEKQIF